LLVTPLLLHLLSPYELAFQIDKNGNAIKLIAFETPLNDWIFDVSKRLRRCPLTPCAFFNKEFSYNQSPTRVKKKRLQIIKIEEEVMGPFHPRDFHG
jgi:hypothetical protein